MQGGILGFAAEGVLRLEVRLVLSARAPAPSGGAVPEAVLPRGELGLALIAPSFSAPRLAAASMRSRWNAAMRRSSSVYSTSLEAFNRGRA